MKAELYQTQKICKCETQMLVTYDIQEKDWQLCVVSGCYLNGRGSNWPQSVLCSGCSKAHRLETFKRIKEQHKPCPFCGKKPKEVIPTQVKCSNHKCPLSQILLHDTLWNTRAKCYSELEGKQ